MKNLENLSRTTRQAHIPIFRYRNISIITLEGEHIMSPVVPTLANITSPSSGPLHNGQVADMASASKL